MSTVAFIVDYTFYVYSLKYVTIVFIDENVHQFKFVNIISNILNPFNY